MEQKILIVGIIIETNTYTWHIDTWHVGEFERIITGTSFYDKYQLFMKL